MSCRFILSCLRSSSDLRRTRWKSFNVFLRQINVKISCCDYISYTLDNLQELNNICPTRELSLWTDLKQSKSLRSKNAKTHLPSPLIYSATSTHVPNLSPMTIAKTDVTSFPVYLRWLYLYFIEVYAPPTSLNNDWALAPYWMRVFCPENSSINMDSIGSWTGLEFNILLFLFCSPDEYGHLSFSLCPWLSLY